MFKKTLKKTKKTKNTFKNYEKTSYKLKIILNNVYIYNDYCYGMIKKTLTKYKLNTYKNIKIKTLNKINKQKIN